MKHTTGRNCQSDLSGLGLVTSKSATVPQARAASLSSLVSLSKSLFSLSLSGCGSGSGSGPGLGSGLGLGLVWVWILALPGGRRLSF